MNDLGTGSILGRLAYSFGYALGRADSIVETGAAALPDLSAITTETYPAGHQNDHQAGEESTYESTADLGMKTGPYEQPGAYPEEEGDDVASAGYALGTLAAGWVLSRIIRPHPVNWPRAVLAGVAATALADLVGSLGRSETTERRPAFPPTAEDLPRYAAGVATAAAYGSQIYPRLPGSPLTRGLIFGTVEATMAESGGALGLVQRYVPQLRLPLASLASHAAPQRSALASLAFGVGLALYAGKSKPKAKVKVKAKAENKGKGQGKRR